MEISKEEMIHTASLLYGDKFKPPKAFESCILECDEEKAVLKYPGVEITCCFV